MTPLQPVFLSHWLQTASWTEFFRQTVNDRFEQGEHTTKHIFYSQPESPSTTNTAIKHNTIYNNHGKG